MPIAPEIKEIITSMIARWGTARLNKTRLLELRDEIEKVTGRRPPSLQSLKTMVRRVAREAAQTKVLREVALVRTAAPIAAPITDRTVLQSIAYDIAGMRRELERIAARLSEIERMLALRTKKE